MNQRTYNKRQRFSIRKYHFGAASVLVGALLLLGQGTVSASENTASSVELAPGNLSQGDSASGETPIASIEKEESANQTFQEPSVEPQSPATVSVDADNRGYSAVAEETVDLDGDGFSNDVEDAAGSDKNDPASTPDDLDGDGFNNDVEDAAGSDKNDPASTPDDLDGDGFSNDAEDAADSDKNDVAPTSDRLVSDVSDLESFDTKTPTSLHATRSVADIETRSAGKKAAHKESINEYYIYDDSAFTYQGGETLFGDGSAQYIPKLYKQNANDGVFHVGFNEDDRSVIFTYLFNPHNETWGFGANVYAFLPGDDIIDPDTLFVTYKKFASARASNGAYTIQNQWEKHAFASDFETVSRNIVNRDDSRFENDFNINVEEKETLKALKPRLGYRFWSKETGGNSAVLYQFAAKVRDNVKSEDIDFLVGNRNLLNSNRASQAWFARSGTFDYDQDGYSDLEEIRRKSNPKDRDSVPDDEPPVVQGNKEIVIYRGEPFKDSSMKVTDNSGKIVSVAIDRGGKREGSGVEDWLNISQDKLNVDNNATETNPYIVTLSGVAPMEQQLDSNGEARYTQYLTAKDAAGNQSTNKYRQPGSPGEYVLVIKAQKDKYEPKLTDDHPVTTTSGTPVSEQAILDKVTVPGKEGVKKTVTIKPDENTLGNGKAIVTVEYPDESTDTIEVPVNVTDNQPPVVQGNKEIVIYRGEPFKDSSMKVTDNSGKIVSVAIDRGGKREGSGVEDWLNISQDKLNVDNNATETNPYIVTLSGVAPMEQQLDSNGEARYTQYLTAKDAAGNQSTNKYRQPGSPGEYVLVIKAQKDKYEPKLTDDHPVTTTSGTPVSEQAILDKVTVPGKEGVKKTVTIKPDENTLGNGKAIVTVEYPDESTDTIEVPVNVTDNQPPVVQGNKEIVIYRGEPFKDSSMKVTDNSGKIVSVAIDRGGKREGSGVEDWLNISQDKLNVDNNATETNPYIVTLSGVAPMEQQLDSNGEARYTQYLTAKDAAGNQSTNKYRQPGSPGEYVLVIKAQKDKYEPKLTDDHPVTTTSGTPVSEQAILDKVTVPGKEGVKKTVTIKPDENTLGNGKAIVTVEYPDESTDTIEVPVNVTDNQPPVVQGNKEIVIYRGEPFKDSSMKVTDNSGKIVSVAIDRGGKREGSGVEDWLNISQDKLNVDNNATETNPYIVTLSGVAPMEQQLDSNGEARYTQYLTAKDAAGNQSTNKYRQPGSPGEYVLVIKAQKDKYEPKLTDDHPVTTTSGTPVSEQAILDKVTVPGKEGVKKTVTIKPDENTLGNGKAIVTVEYPDESTDTIEVPIKVDPLPDSDKDGYPDVVEDGAGSDKNDPASTPDDLDGDGFNNDVEDAAGSDKNDPASTPNTVDSDKDGYPDVVEDGAGSDKNDPASTPDDLDGDGFNNDVEDAAGSDKNDPASTPNTVDSDKDGYPDVVEDGAGSDKNDPASTPDDLDGDGFNNDVEDAAGSDKNDPASTPNTVDSDKDGYPDVVEDGAGSDKNDPASTPDDLDGDGFNNDVEDAAGSDKNDPASTPNTVDSDKDGYPDVVEDGAGSDKNDPASTPDDLDGDGFNNDVEDAAGSDKNDPASTPNTVDSDKDGYPDVVEDGAGSDKNDPASTPDDLDGDGFNNDVEDAAGSDKNDPASTPNTVDSDKDGYPDVVEDGAGSDKNDPASTPDDLDGDGFNNDVEDAAGSDKNDPASTPNTVDSDKDGYPDVVEDGAGSDKNDPASTPDDLDGDGFNNDVEDAAGSDKNDPASTPNTVDSDKDGYPDVVEDGAGSDKNDPASTPDDLDGDGFNNDVEDAAGSDKNDPASTPNTVDSDKDGYPDVVEDGAGSDKNDPASTPDDLDGDGFNNDVEDAAGSDKNDPASTPNTVDSDKDGYPDVVEDGAGSDKNDPASTPDDLDGDGFNNDVEDAAGSDKNDPASTPNTVDSDKDGYPDVVEDGAGSDKNDPASTPDDLDGDGFNNDVEDAAGSDKNDPASTPNTVDSDKDGYPDVVEDGAGSDKNDPASTPDDLDGDGFNNDVEDAAGSDKNDPAVQLGNKKAIVKKESKYAKDASLPSTGDDSSATFAIAGLGIMGLGLAGATIKRKRKCNKQ